MSLFNSNETTTGKRLLIEYYMDQELTKPAPIDKNGNLKLDFGVVLQGSTKNIRLYARNTISYPIQLEPIISDPAEKDLKVRNYPSILGADSASPIDVEFTPGLDRITPLRTSFDFRKIILSSL